MVCTSIHFSVMFFGTKRLFPWSAKFERNGDFHSLSGTTNTGTLHIHDVIRCLIRVKHANTHIENIIEHQTTLCVGTGKQTVTKINEINSKY